MQGQSYPSWNLRHLDITVDCHVDDRWTGGWEYRIRTALPSLQTLNINWDTWGEHYIPDY